MKKPAKSSPIPQGWKFVQLAEAVTEAKSGFACGERDPEGVVQLRMNNVDTRGNFVWDEFIRVPADQDTINEYSLKIRDVLFNNTNSTELVGKSAVFTGFKDPVTYSNHFTRIRTDHSVLLPEFLASWLVHQWQLGVFANICNRWIGQSGVKADKLLSLDFPLPPLSEQKRIVAILNQQMEAVERARKKAEEQAKLSDLLIDSFLRNLFDSETAQRWRLKRIKDITKTCSGSTPSRGRKEYFEGKIPWVKTGELKDAVIDDTAEKVTDLALEECSLPLLPKDTLLVAMYGQGQTRGRTGVLDIEATTNQACFAILPNEPLAKTFRTAMSGTSP